MSTAEVSSSLSSLKIGGGGRAVMFWAVIGGIILFDIGVRGLCCLRTLQRWRRRCLLAVTLLIEVVNA